MVDLGVTPTELKDHNNATLELSNARLGATESMNMVVTLMVFPIPPSYNALHKNTVLEDYTTAPSSESVNGK